VTTINAFTVFLSVETFFTSPRSAEAKIEVGWLNDYLPILFEKLLHHPKRCETLKCPTGTFSFPYHPTEGLVKTASLQFSTRGDAALPPLSELLQR